MEAVEAEGHEERGLLKRWGEGEVADYVVEDLKRNNIFLGQFGNGDINNGNNIPSMSNVTANAEDGAVP
eukprot:CAMPEP_0181100488 /NCGR_PEP_ID=MMETSP1071-20121207/13221_1 /TAXON_ID=35127 /ORGANISM="Thalassiosira sp., Strain NH16" /LENGTH=68 /DNA_ID=CAMNT_0023183223 /DNA_START=350 /DNA_END=553 /DNA_ORIENTATION=+